VHLYTFKRLLTLWFKTLKDRKCSFLRKKSEAAQNILNFIAEAEKHWRILAPEADCEVESIFSDNGGETIPAEYAAALKRDRIAQHYYGI
jgi:hypothetical protein